MDWRLGVTDHTTRPVPLPSDGNVVEECDTPQGTFAPISPRLLPDTAANAPGGHLTIGGVDVIDLAEAVGTPVFIYDETHLRNRCREARQAFGDGVAYASKAFLCSAMASLVDEEGLMIDVASGGELFVALASGVSPEGLILHGSNKSVGELTLALSLGLGRIVVDSFDEIERLERLACSFATGARQKVLLRVNPGIRVRTHAAVATGQEDSKFGFSLSSGAASEAYLRLARRESPVEVVGLHTHVGSQVFDLSAFNEAIEVLAPFLDKAGLAELCIGGGLGVAYTAGDIGVPSITDWAHAVRLACRTAGVSDSVHLTAEPGRAISASAAVTCYTVGTIKSVPIAATAATRSEAGTRTYVSVDGGMSDNPRPALYGSSYEVFLPRDPAARRPLAATVVGKHCESGDILVRDGRLPSDTVVGDLLATAVTGAYGYSMASSYNMALRPPVVFVGQGSYRVVTRRETYKDLLRLDASSSAPCGNGPTSRW
jgi:diaminopimelate decarboxylase